MAGMANVRGQSTNAAPDFNEVFGLIKSNLAGGNESDLNQTAVNGLLEQLHGKAALVNSPDDTNAPVHQAAEVDIQGFEGGLERIRLTEMAEGLAGRITAAQQKFSSTNTNALKGVVLDLRFADGTDYSAAAAVARMFIKREGALLDWGEGMVNASTNDQAIVAPMVVLVNNRTAGAPEALAAVLRQNAQALILGQTTAGEATAGKLFPLKNGQYLRVATASVKLGDGQMLTAAGVKPDIIVSVRPEDARAYYDDPYKDLTADNGPAGAGNVGRGAGSRTRLTEADLIRQRKLRPGMDLEFLPSLADTGTDTNNPTTAGGKPVVRDPVLGRALDLIKGIQAFDRPRANIASP